MFRRILVPIDGSAPSNRGLEAAIAMAKDQSARLCLFHVVDELLMPVFDTSMYVPASFRNEFTQTMREEGVKLLAKAEAMVRRHRLKADTALHETLGRRVAELVIRQAKKWRADVIVLGTHGRRGLSRVLMGSDAEMIVRDSPVPVLLVRATPARRRARKRRR